MKTTSCCILLTLMVGCGIPRDPEGTFQRLQGGRLRVGVTENKPWISLEDRVPRGSEVELVEALARQWGAQITWTIDSESDLVEALHHGKLDLVIGGLRETSPWSSHVSFTRPYDQHDGRQCVMAVRQGENRWLLELDKFLQHKRRKGAVCP